MSEFSLDELREQLAAQLKRYPALQPADAVKFCYQRAFGAAHFCGTEEQALHRLEQECAALAPDSAAPLTEPLGGGVCRLSLPAALAAEIPLPVLARAFAADACAVRTDPAWFEAALQALPGLARELSASFSAEEMEDFLEKYRRQGCPPVSHSQKFHQQYQPHYRVFAGPVARLLPLLAAICGARQKLPADKRLAVAMDGFSAAGKTTAAALLSRILCADTVHMDDFFLPPSLRTPDRFAQPGGNVHYERFAAEVAPHLEQRQAFSYQRFECSRMELGPMVPIGDGPILLVEGAYALHPGCQARYGLTSFFNIAPAQQRRRILERNGPQMLERFEKEWIPLERAYAQAFQLPQAAQLVIESSDF